MTTQPNTAPKPEVDSGETPAFETTKTTERDVKLAFLAVGALIECGSIPLPDFYKVGWYQELSIAVMSVAMAFAAAGVN